MPKRNTEVAAWDTVNALSADERRAYMLALAATSTLPEEFKGEIRDALAKIAYAHERSKRRAASDRRTAHGRRCLVGCNVPWAEYDKARRAAQQQDVTLTAWVRMVVTKATETITKQCENPAVIVEKDADSEQIDDEPPW